MSSKPLANETIFHQKLTLYKIKKDQRKRTHKQAKWVGLILFSMVQFNNIIAGGLVGKMGIFSVILWYTNLQISSVQFTVLFVRFFASYSIPQTFTVYQTLAISLLAVFLGKCLGFFGSKHYYLPGEGQFQIGQDCFNRHLPI